MRYFINRKTFLFVSLLLVIGNQSNVFANFYGENRNGKTFILQVDPSTGIETVFNQDKQVIFLAPGAKRIAVLPTAGWGDYVTNKDPFGNPLPTSPVAGDINGILTLRTTARYGVFDVYRGTSRILAGVGDDIIGGNPASYDVARFDMAASQYQAGPSKNDFRVYLFFTWNRSDATLTTARYDFTNGVLTWQGSVNATQRPGSQFYGDSSTAQAINVNAISDTEDLIVYHPSRQYSLQHVWNPASNNGYWGINYLMDQN
ncbi:hypothetical protein HYY75_10335, partial [bacterium]|nr:hypothetical protein [bacterium]